MRHTPWHTSCLRLKRPALCVRLAPQALLAALLLVLGVFAAAPAQASEPPRRVTLFGGTQYPLSVYFLRGEQPGPTVMVQGGIQGDEVSGYLTAQLLTQAEVERGNLIIIPRANVPTVLSHTRQINVDLNRRFDQDYNTYYEDRLARAIRFLLRSSDAFVHLHEGSGFYSPTYVDNLRNPRRYGQSIIIDTPVFQDRINLAQVATSVLAELNHSIVPAYQFKLFNTNTFASNTTHPEQRKSLTFHALSSAGIPALAIEVSKNIRQLGQKVLWHLRATVLTLEQYGVTVHMPDVAEADIDRYAHTASGVLINGKRVKPGDAFTLQLPPGGTLEVASAEDAPSPFDPVPCVVASDRPGLNLVGASRLALNRFSRLDVKADGTRVAHVNVAWKGAAAPSAPAPAPGGMSENASPLFACWLNGKLRFVPAGGTLEALEGDQLILDGIWGSTEDEVLNFKGFVSQPGRNDGQDAGQEIVLDPGSIMKRYMTAAPDDVWLCRIQRETPGRKRTAFTVRISPRTVAALRLTDAGGNDVIIPWSPGGKHSLPTGDYVLQDIWSNGPRTKVVATTDRAPLPWGTPITLPLRLTLRQATTFKPIGDMALDRE